MLQWRNVPPFDRRKVAPCFGINGVAFKRRALAALWDIFPGRSPELLSAAEIRRANLKLLLHAGLQVTHVQSETWWEHGKDHFHNARTWKVIRRTKAPGADSAGAVAPAPTPVMGRADTVTSYATRIC